ncbi:MAG TPA: hypothetical protein VFY84_00290, partial [Jiangellales bacterium]|nr:hypothetical protein [Jiangellales bacterium]
MLTDRRDELARHRVQTVNRLQRLLVELIPGHHKRDLSALQAKALLATMRTATSPARPADGWQPKRSPTWSRSTPS